MNKQSPPNTAPSSVDVSVVKPGKRGFGSAKGSKLVRRLNASTELDGQALRSIEPFFSAGRQTRKSQQLYSEGTDDPGLFVVESGWLAAERHLVDGRRQVLRTYMPGEIAGISELDHEQSSISIEVLEPGTVYPISPARFEFAMSESVQLTAAILHLFRDEIVALSDRVQAIGRMSAEERLVFFLIKHLQRLRVVDPMVDDAFRLPLSQTDIGDALGLTHTYVSKVMRELDKRGWIERRGHQIKFLEEEAMMRFVGLAD